MRTIIALCGFASCGKDTVAHELVSRLGFVRLSFASSLKDAVSFVFGWDREMLEGITQSARSAREEVDVWWSGKLRMPGFTPRVALQLIGTDVMREHFHADLWILSLQKRILNLPDDAKVVITDCRFPNEISAMHAIGAKVVHVLRASTCPAWFEEYRDGCGPPPPGVHQSEYEWVRCDVDATLVNDGTREELHAKALCLLAEVHRAHEDAVDACSSQDGV